MGIAISSELGLHYLIYLIKFLRRRLLGEGILHGLTEEEAAENASITAKQYHQWRQAGDAELANLADDPTFRTGIHGLLAKTIIRARLGFRWRYLDIMRQCTEYQTVPDRLARVTAAAWLLEHHAVNEK